MTTVLVRMLRGAVVGVACVVGAAVLVDAQPPPVTTTTTVAEKSVKRCGIDRDATDGPGGFYIVRGGIACTRAMSILRAVGRGQGRSIDNNVSLYRGYYCGGRMGSYYCQTTRPFTGRRPGKFFLTRTCRDPGCPARLRADTDGV